MANRDLNTTAKSSKEHLAIEPNGKSAAEITEEIKRQIIDMKKNWNE